VGGWSDCWSRHSYQYIAESRMSKEWVNWTKNVKAEDVSSIHLNRYQLRTILIYEINIK
jgi:hypothetical protein